MAFDYELSTDDAECEHAYQSEDLPKLKRILRGGQYHTVVANPPYITPKDRQLNERYRNRFISCHMKYSLANPFMEVIFRLAARTGFTGQITTNAFMKREFGKKLIEVFFPTVDLTHVIDTSGAYLPGHATPTVILFGRHRTPTANNIRVVMGIRGEPTTPEDPSNGEVWSAILSQIDSPGSQSQFVSVADTPRSTYHKHPWSIGGGGVAELKEAIDEQAEKILDDFTESIGFLSFPGLDDAFVMPRHALLRHGVPGAFIREFVCGERVRDWVMAPDVAALAPYDDNFELAPLGSLKTGGKYLWQVRAALEGVVSFGGQTRKDLGDDWWGWYRWVSHKYRVRYSLVFAQIASHIHFALDEGGQVFNVTAPAVKLSADDHDSHFAMLGLLNSSTSCFWLKQVSHRKQMMGGESVRIDSPAKVPHQYSGTQMGQLPLPSLLFAGALRDRLVALSRAAHEVGKSLSTPISLAALRSHAIAKQSALRAACEEAITIRSIQRSTLIWLQEEIDFTVYAMFGFTDESLLMPDTTEPSWGLESPTWGLEAGQRPFEIMHGTNEDGFTVIERIPGEWPPIVAELWRRRINALRDSKSLTLIERADFKRRWIGWQGKYNRKRDSNEISSLATEWLINRLESYLDIDGRMNDAGEPTAQLEIGLVSVVRLADLAQRDPQFMEVAELYRDRSDFDVTSLVAELVAAESVPLLPVLRYKPAALDTRAAWERTWELQRAEDAIDARVGLDGPEGLTEDQARQLKRETVGDIPVPPKYRSSDFQNANYWRLRGKLDVPKERWVSFPHCEGEDQTLVIAWAGYDHLQLAKAIAAHFADVQQRGGSEDPRLIPLLGCLLELVPWLRQWHNQIDPDFGYRLGDYFNNFVADEARTLGKTVDDIRAWAPPTKAGKGRRKASK